MEENIKTPKYEKGEGDESALGRELNETLKREMNKSPDDINIKKVNSIIDLLDQVDPVLVSKDELSATDFAEKYLVPQGIPIRRICNSERYHNVIWSLRWVACVAVVLMVVVAGNYISVRATNRGIFTNIKERAYILYFDVFGKSSYEKEDIEIEDIEESAVDVPKQEVESWKDAQTITGIKCLFPHYIPEDLCHKEISVQLDNENNIGISGQYYNDTKSVRVIIRSLGDIGVWSSVRQNREGFIEQVRWGNNDVFLYQIDDALQAIFQDSECIYTVETNCEIEILKKIVIEMR